ncbi:beta-defensin-like 1 isoform X2 [Entelurus aequoreus]|uniref:beta-defensin-like 1 isoform X2 n=1 Tax=Entelurus aequoreus TaxID=161455 RepID=UPI002B1D160E|nr:beta-defensin-like 1 isoform X2 [Entelurus aequoreus]
MQITQFEYYRRRRNNFQLRSTFEVAQRRGGISGEGVEAFTYSFNLQPLLQVAPPLAPKYEQILTGPHFGATGAERRMSWYHRALVCTLLVVLLLNVVENEAASFPWSCPSLKGSCRKVCLPTELFFGPLGCGKGFLCCVSHFL